jgi:hypothetical protein
MVHDNDGDEIDSDDDDDVDGDVTSMPKSEPHFLWRH